MTYETALNNAIKSATFLQDKEGSMSSQDVALHVATLDTALRTIAQRNGITLPK